MAPNQGGLAIGETDRVKDITQNLSSDDKYTVANVDLSSNPKKVNLGKDTKPDKQEPLNSSNPFENIGYLLAHISGLTGQETGAEEIPRTIGWA